MGFDPGTMMMLSSLFSTGMGMLNGKDAEQKSSYSGQQQGGFNDIFSIIKGMKGGASNGDITQNQNYQQGQNWLSNLFGNDQGFYDKFEAPMQRQFSEQTIPGLANQFGGMGSGGSLGSTAFRNALGREGEHLQESIAGMRGNMQQQGVNQSMNYAQQPFQNMQSMYGLGLGSPMMNQYAPATTGGFGSLSAPLMQGATSYWGGQGGQNNQGQNNQQSYASGGGNAPMAPPQMMRQYPGQ